MDFQLLFSSLWLHRHLIQINQSVSQNIQYFTNPLFIPNTTFCIVCGQQAWEWIKSYFIHFMELYQFVRNFCAMCSTDFECTGPWFGLCLTEGDFYWEMRPMRVGHILFVYLASRIWHSGLSVVFCREYLYVMCWRCMEYAVLYHTRTFVLE